MFHKLHRKIIIPKDTITSPINILLIKLVYQQEMRDAQLQAVKIKFATSNTAKGLLTQEKIDVLPPATYFYVPKYNFSGNSMELSTQLDLRGQGNYKDSAEAKITVRGLQNNQPSLCCLISTGFFACCIFPCIMLTDCFRKRTEAIYEIKTEVYKKLAVLNQKNTLKYLQLTVTDNWFNKQKATILYNLLAQSSCKGFIFVNEAPNIDMTDGEYSNFDQYMQIFKTIPNLEVNLKWHYKIIT